MAPLLLFNDSAFTPAIRDLIVKKLTDKAAVQLACTCNDALKLVSSIRGEALKMYEETVQEYKELLKKAPRLHGISATEASELHYSLACQLINRYAEAMGHVGIVSEEEQDWESEMRKEYSVLCYLAPVLELLEKDDFVQ